MANAGSITNSATQVYKAMYGVDAPAPRSLPGDRTTWLDPARAEKPTCGAPLPRDLARGAIAVGDGTYKTHGGFNEGRALAFADIERVSADLNGYRSDIQAWPRIIASLESDIATGESVNAELDAWLFLNEPLPDPTQ